LVPQESPVASRIKEAFMGDKGLSGTVRKLPLEDVYKLASVKSVGGMLLMTALNMHSSMFKCSATDMPGFMLTVSKS
jgi:hypothetical protein